MKAGLEFQKPIGYNRNTEHHAEIVSLPRPQSLIGTWRRFGTTGPVYEIVGLGPELAKGDRVMRVRLVETGEEVDYRFTEMIDDPTER